MHKIIRLALSGSGTRYGVQIGALCELTDMGIEIAEAVTTSGGTVAGAVKAALDTSKRMEQMACDLLPRDHLDINGIFSFGGERGLISGAKFRAAFTKNLGQRIEDLDAPRLHIVTSQWQTGKTKVWTHGDLGLAMGASMCLPIFDMVEINGQLYEDGGAAGANFLLDYKGWHDLRSVPLIGLKVKGVGDPVQRPRPRTKVDRLMGTVDNLIAASDAEHIDDAHWAQVVLLETKAPGLDLGFGPDAMRTMIAEGRHCIRQARKAGVFG